jgi:hypothetical protein
MALTFFTPVRLSIEQSDPAELIFSITPLAHLQCEAFRREGFIGTWRKPLDLGSTDSER